MKNRVVYEKEIIDKETGEVVTSEKVTQLPKEPNFVKLYIDDIGKLYNLPKSCSGLMMALVKKIDYEGIITIASGAKKRTAKELGISIQSFDNSIQKLLKQGIMIRIDRGEYMMNPNLFAKGDWTDVRRLRNKYIELNISYTDTGERKVVSRIKDKEEHQEDFFDEK